MTKRVIEALIPVMSTATKADAAVLACDKAWLAISSVGGEGDKTTFAVARCN